MPGRFSSRKQEHVPLSGPSYPGISPDSVGKHYDKKQFLYLFIFSRFERSYLVSIALFLFIMSSELVYNPLHQVVVCKRC
jgi:hypothetical protein